MDLAAGVGPLAASVGEVVDPDHELRSRGKTGAAHAHRGVGVAVGQLGGETPLHVGAAALVLLAGMSDGEIENYMARTPDAAAKRGEILVEITAIRRDGYAVAAGTINPQTAAVAAPVRSSSGETIAAIAISCPIERYTKELNRRCIASVVENARRLSQSLGYRS